MLNKRLIITCCLATASLFSLAAPESSFAAGTIQVTNVPTISSATKYTSLGTILITIPKYAIKSGDLVTMTLPKGFTFNSSFDPKIEKGLNELTAANGTALLSGFHQDDFEGTCTQIGSNMVTIKVNQIGDPTDDFKLAIKLGDVAMNGASDGPVNISFDAPSTSAFPTTSKPKPVPLQTPSSTTQPPQSQAVKTLIFTLGQNSYSLDQQKKSMDVAPYVDETGHVMLPLRFTANALEISDENIKWHVDTQTATLTKGDQVISFTVGQQSYKVNGKISMMDTSLSIRSNRIMVPVRYLSEALGFTVDWESGTQAVTVTF